MVLGTRRTPRGPTYAQCSRQSIPSRLQSINPIWLRLDGVSSSCLRRELLRVASATHSEIRDGVRAPQVVIVTPSSRASRSNTAHSQSAPNCSRLAKLSACLEIRGGLGVVRKPVTGCPYKYAPLGLWRAMTPPQLPIRHARKIMLNS